MDATAPSAAPDETPTIPGSASGLENVPCIEPPGTAERRTDQRGQHDPREADVPEHGVAHARRHGPEVEPDAVQDRAEHLGGADRRRPRWSTPATQAPTNADRPGETDEHSRGASERLVGTDDVLEVDLVVEIGRRADGTVLVHGGHDGCRCRGPGRGSGRTSSARASGVRDPKL